LELGAIDVKQYGHSPTKEKLAYTASKGFFLYHLLYAMGKRHLPATAKATIQMFFTVRQSLNHITP